MELINNLQRRATHYVKDKTAQDAAKEDIAEYLNSIGVEFDIDLLSSPAARNSRYFRLVSHIHDAQDRFHEVQRGSGTISVNYIGLLKDIRDDRKIRERIIRIEKSPAKSVPEPKAPLVVKEKSRSLQKIKHKVEEKITPNYEPRFREKHDWMGIYLGSDRQPASFENYPEQRLVFEDENMLLMQAAWFSAYYKNLGEGVYKKWKYPIEYCAHNASNSCNPCTVRMDGTFVINRDVITGNNATNNENFIYFLIIWCACVHKLNGDFPIADYEALDLYSRQKPRRSFMGILEGWAFTLSEQYDRRRYSLIKNFIENRDH